VTRAEIAFETPREFVLRKPAGVSCELPGEARSKSWIAAMEASLGGSLRLCHRLDRIAQGLVLVARDREAAAFHAEAFRARRVGKSYLARVEGDPSAHLGIVRAYLRRVGRIAKVVRSGGDPASMELLASFAAPRRPGEHHVLVRLHTGRFHQIRSMLASLGHPLAGDVDYGAASAVAPWLESAVLGFRSAASKAWIVAGAADDPRREPVAPEMAEAIALELTASREPLT
jgi:23S rRNA pseudouridine955/2504/2580 synthase